MAHIYDVYKYGCYIEHEYKCAGRYGAKGEKREPRKKASTEQIRKQNQWNREKRVLRIIRNNFGKGDLWVTLKFPVGTRLTAKEMKEVKNKFFRKMRAEYKKAGIKLKYVYRMELSENLGPHMHFVVNRMNKNIGAEETVDVIQRIWEEFGKYLNYTPLYEEGAYKDLAYYITKPVSEDIKGQMTLWGEEEEGNVWMKYGCSRGLEVPEKETHTYKRRTIRKLVENGPKPTKGYYIDQDSIRHGINLYNGMTYYYYTEIKLDKQSHETWKEGGG